MDLTAAVDELYGTAPADFIAVRTRLVAAAKAADDPELAAELKTLRKPTAVAWLLNRVARSEPEVITDLLDLGERMRTAQAKGDGAALAAARPERQEVVDGLVAAARRSAEEAGASFGTAASDGVGSTAVAALADPASGRALASGRLLRPLTYAGFGEVELDDAVALLRLVPPLDDVAEDEAPGDDTADGEDEEGEDDDGDGDEGAPDVAALARERDLAEARDVLREHERNLSAARLARAEAKEALATASADVERLEAEVGSAAERVTDLETRPTARHASDPPSGAES